MLTCSTFHRQLCLLACLLSVWVAPSVSQAGELAVVGFDAPALVVAEQLDPSVSHKPLMGGKLIRLRFAVSTFVSTQFKGVVEEYVVELESPHQSLRMLDLWPSHEAYSDYEGAIVIENSEKSTVDVGFNASAGFEPFARGTASGSYRKDGAVKEQYQRKPPMQTLTSSGTIRRGFGCFFKFRPGPYPDLEGAREIAILAEVPSGWRADMVLVTMRAVGRTNLGSSSRIPLGNAKMWMTIHQEGDQAAGTRARKFIQQEQSLRELAASSQDRVQQKSLPTVWHRLGAALEVVQPRIPSNYLQQVLFGPKGQYFEGDSHRLPVDLRVAILDFWDARQQIVALAFGTTIQLPALPGEANNNQLAQSLSGS